MAFLEDLQEAKLIELSNHCERTIVSGIDVQTKQGLEHFSLTQTDQINILSQQNYIDKGASQVPYHADNKSCRMFSKEEMSALSSACYMHVTYITTYYNRLKDWVKRCTTKEEINAIAFGTPLPKDLDKQLIDITGKSSR